MKALFLVLLLLCMLFDLEARAADSDDFLEEVRLNNLVYNLNLLEQMYNERLAINVEVGGWVFNIRKNAFEDPNLWVFYRGGRQYEFMPYENHGMGALKEVSSGELFILKNGVVINLSERIRKDVAEKEKN